MSKQTHYFAGDGNYGAADKVVIVRTDEWDEDDWNLIEESSDLNRIATALEIAGNYSG